MLCNYWGFRCKVTKNCHNLQMFSKIYSLLSVKIRRIRNRMPHEIHTPAGGNEHVEGKSRLFRWDLVWELPLQSPLVCCPWTLQYRWPVSGHLLLLPSAWAYLQVWWDERGAWELVWEELLEIDSRTMQSIQGVRKDRAHGSTCADFSSMTSKCLSRLRKMFQGAPWACKRPIYWAHNRSLELIYDALTLRNG